MILGKFDRLSFDVIENVLIPEGITVAILPGTRLNILPDVNLRVRGKLMLEGDKDHPIFLTGDQASPWGNLLFENRTAFASTSPQPKAIEAPEADEKGILSFCVIENGLGIIMEGVGPKVSDCTIRQNYGSGIKIHDANVTISNCEIVENISSNNGGGIYAFGDKPVYIESNVILNNYAEENGGGIFAYGEHVSPVVILTDNRIEGNQSQGDGGGVWAYKSSMVNNKLFSNTAKGKGGGLFSTFTLVKNNCIGTNQAAQGGGIFAEADSSFIGNSIEKNTAAEADGGGVYLNFQGIDGKNEIFRRNLVIENSSSGDIPVGGIYLRGLPGFTENNIYKNKGIQLYIANPSNINPLVADKCYWGTVNSVEIEKLIFDHRSDSNLSSVIFEPFATDPIDIDQPDNPKE